MTMLASLTNVEIHLPSIGQIWRTLTLQGGYNAAVVVAGTSLLGLAGGLVGAFAMLRRRTLMGDALAHASLPGIAVAFLFGVAALGSGRSLPLLLLGAAVSGIVGVLTVQVITRFTRLREDAAIGIVLSVFFGAGTVLLSIIQGMQTGEEGGLKTFIYGQTAAMSIRDAFVIGAVATVAALVAILLFKEFRLICFDETFARTQGWPINALDLVMMSLVVVVLVIGLQAVGLLLVVALLIIPPAAARLWTDRFSRMIIASAAIGLASGWLGSSVSALLPRMPAGAVIVLTSGTVFIFSLLIAPRRGVVADWARLRHARARVRRDHLLRSLYESAEAGRTTLSIPVLARELGWSTLSLRLSAWLAARRGLVRTHSTGVSLSKRGEDLAARLTRNHRLWEQYLITYADIAPSHVDWSADMVEHALGHTMVRELEHALAARGHAVPTGVPRSAHPTAAMQGRPGEVQ